MNDPNSGSESGDFPAGARAGRPPERFARELQGLGLEVEPAEAERLRAFLDLLLEVNETTNLTAITDPEQAWIKHIFDALTLVPILATFQEQAESGLRIIDVGSGGGVPAIPLAIVLPECQFTLVEATGKKAEFLRAASIELRLSNVAVLNERAEVVGQSRQHREVYDAAMARALGHLAIVCELCAPLVRPSGIVIAVKGQKADQELLESEKALGLLGLRHVDTSDTPTGRLVLMEKTTRTPRIYPRSNGEPARVPLGVPRARGGDRSPPDGRSDTADGSH